MLFETIRPIARSVEDKSPAGDSLLRPPETSSNVVKPDVERKHALHEKTPATSEDRLALRRLLVTKDGAL